MTLTEILTFVKAGYKFTEIKELMQMVTNEKEEVEHKKEDEPKKENQTKDDDSPTLDNEKEEESEVKNIDYKALYEETQKELKKAQSDNVNKNVADIEKNVDEMLSDMFAEYM